MGMNKHLIPMKSKTTTLVLATILLTSVALAENSPATPAPSLATTTPSPAAPEQITDTPKLPSVSELYGVWTAREIAVTQIAPAENAIGLARRAVDGRMVLFSYQVLPDAVSLPSKAVLPNVVYSAMPSPIDRDDPNVPTYWYPSISFHVDLGRHHRS